MNIQPMERDVQRDLEILTAIDEGRPLTQRDLAQRLGVALGLANLYVKRLARKGFIKITDFPRKPAARKRLRYLLTPKGLAEKSRLTYEQMSYSLSLYRRARHTLRESLSRLPQHGLKRIALYGTGEAAELAYLTLKELGLEPLGVFTKAGGGSFLGFPIRPAAEIADEKPEALILASLDSPEPLVEEVTELGLPAMQVLTLRQPRPQARAGGDSA
jgi:DNA-binding MarR family transcriptional regulator